MAIEIEAYTGAGLVRGVVPRAGSLRDVLDSGPLVDIERATIAALGPPAPDGSDGRAPRPAGDVALDPDELLIIVERDRDVGPVHAQWHAIRLVVGPYLVEGELPTMPGFDPGRALARPSGTFVHLRDTRIALADDQDRRLASLPGALVNRYAVEEVDADILLVVFFPGATQHVDHARAGAAV